MSFVTRGTHPQPFISSSVKVRESHEAAMPLSYLAPRHKVTEQFVDLWGALSPR